MSPENKNNEESWINSKWRPCMGWLYMATCAFDFILGPIFWAILQASAKQGVTQWIPLTLQGAGLYHVAMGAVLGVAAWSRGQEKMNLAPQTTTQKRTMTSTMTSRNSSPEEDEDADNMKRNYDPESRNIR